MIRRTLATAFLAALLWMACGQMSNARADTAWIHLEPEYHELDAGDTIDVKVIVEDVENLFGVDIRLRFDPELLEMVDATPGDGIVKAVAGEFPFPDFLVKNQGNNRDGTMWYAATQLAPREAASGTGTVMTMRFKGIAPGTSAIEFYDVSLVNADGVGISIEESDSEIIIVGELTATPTYTRRPTRTATPKQENTALADTPEANTATPAPAAAATATSMAYPPQPGAIASPTRTVTRTPLPSSGNTPRPAATFTPSQRPGYPGIVPTMPPSPFPTKDVSGVRATSTLDQGAPASLATPTGLLNTPSAPRSGTDAPTVAPATVIPAPIDGQPTAVPDQPPPATSSWVIMVVPTAVPPATVPPEREEFDPLVPQEMFVCFVIVLFLFAVVLAIYLVRRDRALPPESSA